MSILYAIIFGVIQGLTEFLPVSSSGHLVLFNNLIGANTDFVFFAVLLHLATLLAIIIVFRKQIVDLIRHPFSKKAVMLYIATIPTIIIVLILNPIIERSFGGSALVICFLITAILLFVTDILGRRKIQYKEFNYKHSIIMGIAQGLAVFPGISRSGATICTGLILGQTRKETAEFSFLMSIPIILASMAYEIFKAINSGKTLIVASEILPTLIAFITAFIVGIFAIKIMLKVVEKSKYFYFSIYLIALSILTIFII